MTTLPVTPSTALVKMTNIRWRIMFLVFVILTLNYLDRVNISIAAPLIQKEFGFSPVQLGVIFSAFTWGNVLGQLPGGALSSVFGAKRMYVIAIVCWSALLAATSLATSVTTFVIFRVVFGFFEGMCWPVASTVGATWFPKSERSRAMSLQANGMVVGLAIAPPFVTYFMMQYGWRGAFLVSAGLSLIWLIFWIYTMNDRPDKHPNINNAELKHIADGQVISAEDAANEQPLSFMEAIKVVIKKPSLYAACLSNGALVWTLYTYTSWLPLYLQHERGFTITKTGFIAMLPFLFSMITIPCGGIVSDWLYKRTGNLKLAKNLPIMSGLFAGGVMMIPAALAEDPMTGVFLLSIGYSLIMFILGPQWAIPPDVGGKKAAGYACALVQIISHIPGIIAPIFMGYIVQATGHYTAGVVTAGVVAMLGALLFPILYRGEKDHYSEPQKVCNIKL
ncbi:MFS transporter [Anaerospora sp.]|uniref:MFS transporter n=1 Tax=Anaerospora sp. TaxID=1960278 RepID=UPI00289F9B2F|nr:MFS transporter [Anaerospora sp.]